MLLFWYIMSWSDLGRSNSSIFYEWAIFLLLWYTLRLFQFLLVCRSLSVWKKNLNHQFIITLLQLFEKRLTILSRSINPDLITKFTKFNTNSYFFFVFFKHILFLLRFTLRISSSRSLSLWFFAMHIQCKLYTLKKRKWTI